VEYTLIITSPFDKIFPTCSGNKFRVRVGGVKKFFFISGHLVKATAGNL
jgi:hypothetical protein